MKHYLAIFSVITMLSCSTKSRIHNKQIVYVLPSNIENLIKKQIEKKPNSNYCLLFKNNSINEKEISIVEGYSFYHKNTSYSVLIGDKYYPISFPQFDIKFGTLESQDELLEKKKDLKNNELLITSQSYPLYHGTFIVRFDNKNNVLYKGWVY